MGQVVPLRNVYCELKRLQELQEIGALLIRAEQLFAALRPSMDFNYRSEIVRRANELLEEAQDRRALYFMSAGLPAPTNRIVPCNFKECE